MSIFVEGMHTAPSNTFEDMNIKSQEKVQFDLKFSWEGTLPFKTLHIMLLESEELIGFSKHVQKGKILFIGLSIQKRRNGPC